MTNQHLITPSPDLVSKWASEFYGTTIAPGEAATEIAIQAARWGADQELEACCEWLTNEGLDCFPMQGMRKARRPKPPSLKELAVAALNRQAIRSVPSLKGTEDCDIIRRALEALPD